LKALALSLLLALSASAATLDFAGTLSNTDGTFNRPLAGSPPANLSAVGTNVFYDAYTFQVLVAGIVTLETTSATLNNGSADDTFLALYTPSFNPASPLTNILQSDDDAGPGALSLISRNLAVGTYVVVATSFSNGQEGDYNLRITGDVASGVPEPSSALLLVPAVAALAWRRRRA